MNTYPTEPAPRRERRMKIIGAIAGVLALIPAAFTAWFAAFCVVGLSGSDTTFDPESFVLELISLIITGLLLALFPMIMTLGGQRRRWVLISLVPIVGVPIVGLLLSLPYWI